MRPHAFGLPLLVVPSQASQGVATKRVCRWHGGGRMPPHLGLGRPLGCLRGQSMPQLILRSCETSLDDEGSAPIGV